MTCQRIDGSTDRREDVRETLGRRPLHEQPEGESCRDGLGKLGRGDGDAGLEWGAQLVSSVSDLMGFKFG